MKRAPAAAQAPGTEVGDHVYVQHPARGPIAVRVLAHGRDGMTAECDRGQRHRIPWDRYLGHKTRMLHRYEVVDQGADGAVLADDRGRRRYLDGKLPVPEMNATPAEPAESTDDPLLGGMGRLKKAETAMPESARVILLKAGPIANRQGLSLQERMDKEGHETKRWVRMVKEPPPHPRDKGPAPMKHGDTVGFRHGDVEGHGQIVASGADGVTVRHEDGNESRVRHEHLTGPKPEAAGPKEGGDGAKAPSDKGVPAGPADTPEALFGEEEVAKLPAKVNQPVKDEAELYSKSTSALEHLQAWLNKGKGVCSQLGYQTMTSGMEGVDWAKPGGMLFIAPLKGKKRAAQKVEQDYGGDWSQLRDVVRCSIAVDNMGELRKALDVLKKSGLELAMQPKDRFNKPLDCGYRDLLMNVKFPNGIIGEVQLHVKPMLAAKEEGHKYYETERSLLGRGEESWTDEDKAKVRDAHQKQAEIYGKAWQTAMGGKGKGEEPMEKALEGDAGGYDYFDHDGATFRRRKGKASWAVDDVLHGKEWKPYTGDALQAGMFGDAIEDPSGGGEGAEPEMAKARILFLKAQIPGGASGDLFSAPVAVRPHMRGASFVGPYIGRRRIILASPSADRYSADVGAKPTSPPAAMPAPKVETKMPKPNVTVNVLKDAVRVGFPYDKAMLGRFKSAFPRARWDAMTKTWSVEGKTAEKRVREWVDSLSGIAEAEAEEEAAAKRAFEAAPAVSSPYVSHDFTSRLVNTRFNERVVELLKKIPGAKFQAAPDGKGGTWRIPYRSSPQLEAVRAEIEAIGKSEDNKAAARRRAIEVERGQQRAQRDKERADKDARMVLVRASRTLFPLSRMPPIGVPMRLGDRVVVYESVGKPFYIDEDMPSIHGTRLLGHEGERGAYAYFRPASEAEVAEFDAREAATARAAADARAKAARFRELAQLAQREGERPSGSNVVDGEVLASIRDDLKPYGGGEWWVAADDGLWHVRNNGADGDNWAANNVRTGGAGAIGHRLPRSPAIEAELRAMGGD